MARVELEQDEVEELLPADDDILEATNDEDAEELVEFQADGEDSSVPDPISTGSSRRKADKSNAMPMQKLGKTGVIANVVNAFAKMTPGQASKAYKGLMDSTGNKGSIAAKGDAKAPVKLHMMANIKVKEDLEALFADKDQLNEDFFDQATTIFEAALNAKATLIEVALKEQYETEFETHKTQFNEELETKVDEYLEYVADTWMEQNEIAIEAALKVEMAETFMDGVKKLFSENLIYVPEDKVDHVAELESSLEESKGKLDESINETISLTQVIKEQNAALRFSDRQRGLTLKQQDEFKDLVEGLDYDNLEDYDQKLDVILETYFNKKPALTEDTLLNESDPVDVDSESGAAPSSGPMDAYAQAISRTLRS